MNIKNTSITILLVVLGIILLFSLTNCGLGNHLKPRASKIQVLNDLRATYDEDFVVISREKLPNTTHRSRITAYQAYPKDNPELIFNVFQSISPPSSGDTFGSSSFYISSLGYHTALVKQALEKWLEESKWKYTTEYNSIYVDWTNEELTEKYYGSCYI